MYVCSNAGHKVNAHKLRDALRPVLGMERTALVVKQGRGFITCKQEDGRMNGWRDGLMQGQNRKIIKGMRKRQMDGRTGGQTDDGCRDGWMKEEDSKEVGAQIKLF